VSKSVARVARESRESRESGEDEEEEGEEAGLTDVLELARVRELELEPTAHVIQLAAGLGSWDTVMYSEGR
jgi:hypothetical protein